MELIGFDTSLRANCENLEAVAGSMHSGDKIETEANIKQVLDMDTIIGFCIQAGQAIAFDSVLAEASGVVLEDGEEIFSEESVSTECERDECGREVDLDQYKQRLDVDRNLTSLLLKFPPCRGLISHRITILGFTRRTLIRRRFHRHDSDFRRVEA